MQYLIKECAHGELGFDSPSTPAYLKGNTEIVFLSLEIKLDISLLGQSSCAIYLAAWRVRAVTAAIKITLYLFIPFVIFKFFALAALIVLRRRIPASAACNS